MTENHGQAARKHTKENPMATLYVRNGTEFREATPEEISSHAAVADRTRSSEGETNLSTFKTRHLLVSTYGDLRIGGRWFELAGFSSGARVSVQVFGKRLVIDVIQEPLKVTPRQYRRSAP
jgi:hypothetical protein